jgi:hypothetical protein
LKWSRLACYPRLSRTDQGSGGLSGPEREGRASWRDRGVPPAAASAEGSAERRQYRKRGAGGRVPFSRARRAGPLTRRRRGSPCRPPSAPS